MNVNLIPATWKLSSNFRNSFCLSVAVLMSAIPAQAALCPKWSAATEVGKLSTDSIDEQSGTAASSKYARIYHNNDSGDYSMIYATDLSGKLVSTISYSNQLPLDVEDLSYGKCDASGKRNCIYVGDIGDNLGIRPAIGFHVVEELEKWPAKVSVLRSLVVRYPDGTHDAESFAIHPNGDLILITKAYKRKLALKANVYRLEAKKVFAGGIQMFTKIGELNLPSLTGSDKYKESVATSMSIAPNGKSFLILTYNSVIEVAFDFSKEAFPTSFRAGVDYQIIKIAKLEQMEGITHSSDGKSFFYSSESSKKSGVPLMHVRCLSN